MNKNQALRTAIITALLLPTFLYSQVINDFGFIRSNEISVDGLVYPWAGGLNACQFSTIDLNQDGLKDLFVFDKHSGRIVTFLNNGSTTSNPWELSNDYAAKFPTISDWVRLADYNCDGKEDIFTYSVGFGAMKVYLNVSNAVDGLKFKMMTNSLSSLQYMTYNSIYVSSVDYPAISDIDNDGDLDILNFWILGTYIYYHRNLSMEKYGTCDSLDFRLEHRCWGYVQESNSVFKLYLNMPCLKDCLTQGDNQDDLNRGSRHSGSTMLAIQLNNDTLMDLILGDVDFPNIIALTNGGTTDTAKIVLQDTAFPAAHPVDLVSFPAVDYMDLTGDGVNDMVVSPFDPNILTPKNINSVWMYKNTGTSTSPQFQYIQQDFLQGEMIDLGTASYPVFEDVDSDGLTDLIVGCYGIYDSSWMYQGILKSSFTSRLFYYHNTGTTANPAFQLLDTNYADIYSLHLKATVSAFGDPDYDLDRDMLIGCSDGTLIFFENTAGPGQIPEYAPPVLNYNGIDVGKFSAPQWIDLDSDGLLDLVIGDLKGLLAWYRNTGSAFVLVNDSLGGVDVRDSLVSYDGYSIPCFFKGYDDKLKLFVGSNNGGIAYYKDIEGHLNDVFTSVSRNYLNLREGSRSAPTVALLDADTLFELINGNTSGGLFFFKGAQPGPDGIDEYIGFEEGSLRVYPNPANQYITISLETPVNIEFQGVITDFTGRELIPFSMYGNSLLKLNLGNLQNGIYLLTLWRKSAKVKESNLVRRIILCR